MPGKPIFTETWGKSKVRFLSRHDFKAQVETCLDQLEKIIAENQPWALRDDTAYFSVETSLPHVEYGCLACLCAVNPRTRDYAPAALYFPGATQTESVASIVKALADVRTELGW